MTTSGALQVRVPRGLLLLTCAWIFASWGVLLGFRPPIQPQAASYGPSIQLFFLLIALGIAIAWPLLRLSGPPLAPLRQSFFDAIVIGAVVQLVLWPSRLLTLWSIERTALLDLAIFALLAATMALLSLCMASPRVLVRTGWMLLLIMLALVPMPDTSMSTRAGAFTPSLPSSHLIYRIARADPGQPAEQLVRDTKEALFGAGLMTVSALGVALMRRMRRLRATSKIMSLPVSTSEKVE